MKKRTLSDAMIRDIAERYPELKGATWDETRARVLEGQADAAAQASIQKLDASYQGETESP